MTHEQRPHDGFPQDKADENASTPAQALEDNKSVKAISQDVAPTPETDDASKPISPKETALAALPPLDAAYTRTIVSQLGKTIPYREDDSFKADVDEAIAAYRLMNPKDPADSAICRLTIALTNVAMDSIARTTIQGQPSLVRDRDLKLSLKAAVTVAELIKVRDARQALNLQSVNVGQVNIQSGGRAIIGNVNQPKPDEEPTDSTEVPDDAEQAA